MTPRRALLRVLALIVSAAPLLPSPAGAQSSTPAAPPTSLSTTARTSPARAQSSTPATARISLSASVQASPTAVAQTSALQAKRLSAKLHWDPGAARRGVRVASWNVYRAPESAGPFAIIASVLASSTSYTDRSVVDGSRYFYRVTAVSAAGVEGPPSSTVMALIAPPGTLVPSAPVSFWPPGQPPPAATAKDKHEVELGLRFSSSVPGQVTGVRFYKPPGNKGRHTATLWSSTGASLATASFTEETPNGWQTLLFAAPVPIDPGAEYVVSYHTTAGHYAYDKDYFTAAHDARPSTPRPAPASSTTATPPSPPNPTNP